MKYAARDVPVVLFMSMSAHFHSKTDLLRVYVLRAVRGTALSHFLLNAYDACSSQRGVQHCVANPAWINEVTWSR